MARRSPTQTFFDLIFIAVFLLLLLAAQPDHMLQQVVADCHSCAQLGDYALDQGEQFRSVLSQTLLAFREVLDLVGGIGGFW